MPSQLPAPSYSEYCKLIDEIVNPRRPPAAGSQANAAISLWLHDLERRRPWSFYCGLLPEVRQEFLRVVKSVPLDGDLHSLPTAEDLQQRAFEAYQEHSARREALLDAQDLFAERDRERSRSRSSRGSGSRSSPVVEQTHVEDTDPLQPYTPGARSSTPHHAVFHPHVLSSRSTTPTILANQTAHGSRPPSRHGNPHDLPPSRPPHDPSAFVDPSALYIKRPSFEPSPRRAPYPTGAQRPEVVWQKPDPSSSSHNGRAHDPHTYQTTHFDEAWTPELERSQ